MIGWREKAQGIRARQDWRIAAGATTTAREKRAEAPLPEQAAFAQRVIQEVLIPVLTEFAGIVTDTAAKPVYHEYDERALGVSCDLNSQRFTTKVYLLPDVRVRLTVFLTPSQTEGQCKDFGLSARNDEIEEWFGDCLARLYDNR
jgi:hypothetical protein